MTYIAIIRDGAGKQISFERFSCKKAETVKRNMQQLFKNELYRVCIGNAATVDVYATPDGYNLETTLAASFTV